MNQESNELVERVFGESSFASCSLVDQRNVVKNGKDIDLVLASPLGQRFQTGASSVLNVLKPESEGALALFEAGAVGPSAMMAAKIGGSEHIIAVDLHENRLELAKELRATASIVSGKDADIAGEIQEITGTGVQNILDTTGVDAVIEQAVSALDSFGKLATVVTDDSFSVPLEILALKGASIVGTSQGDATPQEFIPEMISQYKNGQFPFDKMVKYYDFEQINQAF